MRLVNIFLLIFCVTHIVGANEGGGGHEAPAGGHGSGSGAPEADYSGKQTQEWSEVQAKLSALKSKVEAQEALVKSLIVEASGGHGAPAAGGGHEAAPAGGHGSGVGGDAMGARIEQLKKEHQKLQTMIADYNKMNAAYETRFPEKGLKESRIYRRTDPQAIQLDETASNYEEKVQRLQTKIMRQYPRTAKTLQTKKQKTKTVAAEPESSKKHSEKKSGPESNKSGEVTDQIILQK